MFYNILKLFLERSKLSERTIFFFFLITFAKVDSNRVQPLYKVWWRTSACVEIQSSKGQPHCVSLQISFLHFFQGSFSMREDVVCSLKVFVDSACLLFSLFFIPNALWKLQVDPERSNDWLVSAVLDRLQNFVLTLIFLRIIVAIAYLVLCSFCKRNADTRPNSTGEHGSGICVTAKYRCLDFCERVLVANLATLIGSATFATLLFLFGAPINL